VREGSFHVMRPVDGCENNVKFFGSLTFDLFLCDTYRLVTD
jgi:hypothetical protein